MWSLLGSSAVAGNESSRPRTKYQNSRSWDRSFGVQMECSESPVVSVKHTPLNEVHVLLMYSLNREAPTSTQSIARPRNESFGLSCMNWRRLSYAGRCSPEFCSFWKDSVAISSPVQFFCCPFTGMKYYLAPISPFQGSKARPSEDWLFPGKTVLEPEHMAFSAIAKYSWRKKL